MNVSGSTQKVGPLWQREDFYCLAALLAAVAIVFARSLTFGFLEWDDPVYLTRNPLVQSLSAENIRAIFTTYLSGNYHPLPLLTYALEHSLFGLNPFIYRLDNLLLHSANALLLYALLRRLDFGPRAVVFACLFFAINPLKVEPVVWVTGRKDLLSSFFCLLSLNSHALWVKSREKEHLYCSFVLFVLALLSKGTAMAMPFLYFAVDLSMGRKIGRSALLEKLPFLALAALFGVIALYARASYQDVLIEGEFSLRYISLSSIHRLFSYYFLRSLIPWPHIFSPFLSAPRIYSPLIVFATAGTLSLVAAYFALRKRTPPGLWIGLAFFAVAIAPSLPLPVVGYTADRFAYLPSVGLSLSLCSLLSLGWRPKVVAAMAAAALLLYGAMALQRCEAWRDDVTLATDALESFEGKAGLEFNLSIGHRQRGRAYLRMGELKNALMEFEEARRGSQGMDLPFVELGYAFLESGDPQKALEAFGHGIEDFPAEPLAYVGRASAFIALGRYDEAARDLETAQAMAPGYEEIYRVWEKLRAAAQ
jgi:tetratricopeptide (TPR) repeat protein